MAEQLLTAACQSRWIFSEGIAAHGDPTSELGKSVRKKELQRKKLPCANHNSPNPSLLCCLGRIGGE